LTSLSGAQSEFLTPHYAFKSRGFGGEAGVTLQLTPEDSF